MAGSLWKYRQISTGTKGKVHIINRDEITFTPPSNRQNAEYKSVAKNVWAAVGLIEHQRHKRADNFCLLTCIPCFLDGFTYSVKDCKEYCEMYHRFPPGCDELYH